jgi:hypothetical protein
MRHPIAAPLLLVLSLMKGGGLTGAEPSLFDIRLDTISTGFDYKSCWVHPRAGAIPGSPPEVVLTMQKAMLVGSDIFFALNEMRTDDLGGTWSAPVEHAATLGRREEPGGIVVAASDFWPKWHAKSGKLLGIGHTVRYQNDKVMPAPNHADFSQCMKFGSNNAVFAARILWKNPNTTWNQR